jgi:hypothetical protein
LELLDLELFVVEVELSRIYLACLA